MEPVTCINTGLNPSVYKFKGWNLMYYDRKFSTLMFFGSGFLPMIWWNDLIIWSCWIKQGSHDVITGMCQWNQCISWCQRLFTLLEWILLKGLQQVLHCFSSVSVWFCLDFIWSYISFRSLVSVFECRGCEGAVWSNAWVCKC